MERDPFNVKGMKNGTDFFLMGTTLTTLKLPISEMCSERLKNVCAIDGFKFRFHSIMRNTKLNGLTTLSTINCTASISVSYVNGTAVSSGFQNGTVCAIRFGAA